MYKKVFSTQLTDRVLISTIKNTYTVNICSNETEIKDTEIKVDESNPSESSVVEVSKYQYDVNSFTFNDGTLNISDIIANPDKYVSFEGNIESQKKALIDGIQVYMDKEAQKRGYDGIMSVITYADEDSVERYQLEGLAARKWRSLCWAYGLQVLNECAKGDRTIPTLKQLIEELPQPEWPF